MNGPGDQTLCNDANADAVSVMSPNTKVSHTLQHALGRAKAHAEHKQIQNRK